MPVGHAKFDVNLCNESPLWGEKPEFWPVSKYILAVALRKHKHHIFAPTAGARCTIFPKLCVVIELVVPVIKGAFIFRSNV